MMESTHGRMEQTPGGTPLLGNAAEAFRSGPQGEITVPGGTPLPEVSATLTHETPQLAEAITSLPPVQQEHTLITIAANRAAVDDLRARTYAAKAAGPGHPVIGEAIQAAIALDTPRFDRVNALTSLSRHPDVSSDIRDALWDEAIGSAEAIGTTLALGERTHPLEHVIAGETDIDKIDAVVADYTPTAGKPASARILRAAARQYLALLLNTVYRPTTK
jgi:hypothetical protein